MRCSTTLEVRPVRVSPAYQGTGFVYRREELRYETDYYNEFFTSPGAMVTQEVREWLTDSGLFSLVLDNPSDLQTAYLVEGDYLRMGLSGAAVIAFGDNPAIFHYHRAHHRVGPRAA